MAADAILTLDRGNTTLDVMWHGEVTERRRLDPEDLAGLAHFLKDRPAPRVAGLSVVRGGLDPVARLLAKRGWSLLTAGEELTCPLRLAYADGAAVGVDRWVGAFAAHRLFGAAVVVDCGTALTVNLVDAAGCFLGGAIAPGLVTMARSLEVAAPALPVVELAAEVELPATSPDAAVNAGVKVGFCGMIDALVKELVDASGLVDETLVITGGGAPCYLEVGRGGFDHQPDLIHQGLRWLAEASNTAC